MKLTKEIIEAVNNGTCEARIFEGHGAIYHSGKVGNANWFDTETGKKPTFERILSVLSKRKRAVLKVFSRGENGFVAFQIPSASAVDLITEFDINSYYFWESREVVLKTPSEIQIRETIKKVYGEHLKPWGCNIVGRNSFGGWCLGYPYKEPDDIVAELFSLSLSKKIVEIIFEKYIEVRYDDSNDGTTNIDADVIEAIAVPFK